MSSPATGPSVAGHEYDRFAPIYAVWTGTAASARANLAFYVDAYVAARGPIVELGVGDGRIAVEAAARGCRVVGVDLSPAMLDLCRARAARAGVMDRLTLVEADFRQFALDAPVDLIALPYHSIGHLTTVEAKRAAVAHIFSHLRPGGRFLFDDFLMTPALLAEMRQVQLRAAYRSDAGSDVLLWVTSLVDVSSQTLTMVTWEDELEADGLLARRRYRRVSLSWLDPQQAKGLLQDAGFLIEACYGDFEGTPLAAAGAHEQVWIARKPEAPQ